MDKLLIQALTLGLLSACASDATMRNFHYSKLMCESAGDAHECINAQIYEKQAHDERMDSAGKIAVGVILVPLIVGAAILAATPPPQPTYTTTCSSWGRSTTCTSY